MRHHCLFFLVGLATLAFEGGAVRPCYKRLYSASSVETPQILLQVGIGESGASSTLSTSSISPPYGRPGSSTPMDHPLHVFFIAVSNDAGEFRLTMMKIYLAR